MKEEEWIESVLESAGRLKPAEANPYLFTKIRMALERSSAPAVQRPVAFRMALTVAAVLIMNLGCLVIKNRTDQARAGEAAMISLTAEMGFNNTLNY